MDTVLFLEETKHREKKTLLNFARSCKKTENLLRIINKDIKYAYIHPVKISWFMCLKLICMSHSCHLKFTKTQLVTYVCGWKVY